jgi:sporulation protein YlmC with PRC-barrel domain
MRLTSKQLKKMQVETISGIKLGKIQEVIMDIENQMLVQYDVKASGLAKENYLVNRDQIARFEPKKIIVYDTVVNKKEKKIY